MKKNRFSLKMPKGYSKSMHASVLMLNIFGLLMIISATATVNSLEWSRLVFVIIKEVIFIVISYVLMVQIARKFSHSKLKKHYNKLLLLTFAALLLTLVHEPVNGARAWLRFGPFLTIQPSEFAKIMIILILAHSLGEREHSKEDLSSLITHPVVMILLMGFIVIYPQSDLGSAMIMMLIALLTTLVFANKKLQPIQTTFVLLFMVYIAAIVAVNNEVVINFFDSLGLPGQMQYMIDRVRTSANPFLDRYNTGAQIFNGLAAFVSGGFFGVGYGKGFLKFSFIFATESDSILPIIIEELGIVFGFLPIVLLYSIIFYQLIKYTFLVMSEKDKAILVGTLSYFFIHFLLNVGGVSGLIPLTGIPLLFISAGGSSRLAIMIAIGLTQNVIARYNINNGKLS